MKKIVIIALSVFAISNIANADYVNGYYKSNGTYVQGYHRSHANGTKFDNYSTKGNINPYTGKTGTVSVY